MRKIFFSYVLCNGQDNLVSDEIKVTLPENGITTLFQWQRAMDNKGLNYSLCKFFDKDGAVIYDHQK